MSSPKNVPKWVALGIAAVFVLALALGLMKRASTPQGSLAAVEETLQPAVSEDDRFYFAPQPEPAVEDKVAAPDEEPVVAPPRGHEQTAGEPGSPALSAAGHTDGDAVLLPPLLPLPGDGEANTSTKLLPDLAADAGPPAVASEHESYKTAAATPIAPPAGDHPPRTPTTSITPPVEPNKKPALEPAEPKACTTGPIAGRTTTPPKPDATPGATGPEPAPVKPSGGVQAAVPPESSLTNPPPPGTKPAPDRAEPLVIAMSPVKPDTAPARNGATHRSSYLISPGDMNSYRKANGLAPVPHAAEAQSALATHAEALGFVDWLTRTHHTAGILSASEVYRLPLSSENKIYDLWAQDSAPQAANETKHFGIVRVKK